MNLQLPPLTYSNIRLLLAVDAIILLITSELIAPHFGLTNLIIDDKKLQNVALVAGAMFLITAIIQIISIFVIP